MSQISGGGDVAILTVWFVESFSGVLVVGTFSMSFLGGKYFKAVVSVLVYEITTLRHVQPVLVACYL